MDGKRESYVICRAHMKSVMKISFLALRIASATSDMNPFPLEYLLIVM